MVVKISKKPVAELQAELEKAPKRVIGRWADLIAEVVKSGQGAEVTGLTRGQAWGLMRTAKNAKCTAQVLDKGTRVIILPPAKASK